MRDRDEVIIIVQELSYRDTIRTSDIQHLIGVGYTKAVKILMDLSKMGLVEREKKPGQWKVNKENVRKYYLYNVAN